MNNGSGGSFPFFGILGLIFVTLKLTGHITWSWWWVTAPFWGPVALAIPLLIVGGLIALVAKRALRKSHNQFRNDPFDHPFFKNN